MKTFVKRRNDFLLEQDDPAAAAPGEGSEFSAPKSRLLSTPNVEDTLLDKDASVDEKIDKYIMQYEKEAVPIEGYGKESEPSASNKISERKFSKLSYFLFEQDTAAPAPDAAADAAAPAEETPAPSDSPTPGPGAKTQHVPKINIRKFAQGIARLANNFQSLIDPKRVILNRAQAYIVKNYSVRLAKELMSILERDFDLTPKTNDQRKMESPPAPPAGAAGSGGGGGGGA